MKYRAEIDGLRALAVLPVIFFHAGFQYFGGGFVGVDVFFVISGYLITTILITEMQDDNFSLINFYERRARRILPALFFIVILCIPFSFLVLMPTDLKDFGQSMVAVSTFSSNFLFWLESGYFDSSTELKPLIHTWSLAVEEQYYIIFPIFLLFFWRFGIQNILIFLFILFLVSISFAHWSTNYSTNSMLASGAFYLLPARAWELLIGVFAAFYLKYRAYLKSKIANEILSLIGLCLILYSVVSFDEKIPFPSFYTLVPTIGAAFLILFSVPGTLTNKILSFKPLVGLGLISYSAYLWHQPLLAFAKYRLLENVPDFLLLILCFTSIFLAWLSWRFIEKPFRDKRQISRPRIFKTSLITMIIITLIGLSLHATKGISTRTNFTEEIFDETNMFDENGSCFGRVYNYCNAEKNNRKIIVLGDSTSQAFATSLAKLSNDFDVVPITLGGCLPFDNFDLYSGKIKSNKCTSKKIQNDIVYIESLDNPVVIYAGMFTKNLTNKIVHHGKRNKSWDKEFLPNSMSTSIELELKNMINRLSQISHKVYVIDSIEFGINAQKKYFYGESHEYKVEKNYLKKLHQEGSEFLNLVNNYSNVLQISLFNFVCDENYCSPFQSDGKPLYIDEVHPNLMLSDRVAEYIIHDLSVN